MSLGLGWSVCKTGISTFNLQTVEGFKIEKICKTVRRMNSSIKIERFVHSFSPNRLKERRILLVKHIIITIYPGNKKRATQFRGVYLDIPSSEATAYIDLQRGPNNIILWIPGYAFIHSFHESYL